ncbi:Uncharacterised protein [Vibrio cholerae]|nr:Uncharacterised protein [Vibrio cholerae]
MKSNLSVKALLTKKCMCTPQAMRATTRVRKWCRSRCCLIPRQAKSSAHKP